MFANDSRPLLIGPSFVAPNPAAGCPIATKHHEVLRHGRKGIFVTALGFSICKIILSLMHRIGYRIGSISIPIDQLSLNCIGVMLYYDGKALSFPLCNV